MRSAMFALLAVTAIASSSGCCCLERWWCKPWGCQGGCGGCDSCGGGCDSCGAGNGGYVGYEGEGGGGGCGCGAHGGDAYAGGHGHGGAYAGGKVQPHPHAHYARNDGGQQFFDSGPAVPSVTYPYYTNRGPRDYLAKNPRGIGP